MQNTSQSLIFLRDIDFYKISLSSHGCFHSDKDSILISKNKDSYVLKWGTKSKVQDKNDIESIRHFEIEMTYFQDLGCTTVDTYIINYNGKDVVYNDGSCVWRGAYHLKKELFKE